MLIASARRRMAALRHQPRRAARIARALWIAWAVVVWNVVFDHVIVVAGRNFIAAAGLAAASEGTLAKPLNMDDWMRPAIGRAFWIATTAASAILFIGLSSIHLSARLGGQTPVPPQAGV